MERANTGFTTKPYVEGRTVAAAFLLLTLTQLKLETLEEKNDVEVVVLSRASAAAAAADGGAGAAALRLPSPRRAQPHAPPHLRRRFRQARHHLPLPGLLSPGQALDHPNHAQADRQSSRRCHRNRPLDHKPEESIAGDALFRWQSDVNDPHTLMDLYVSTSDP
ncbi:hypothetical protein glysoja_022138 [Glycine soja]|nr:hypothetical protein glysoja_022138 [Glycine soja]